MKAVILSSDEGNRLRPITCSIPKLLLPIMGRPLAEHTVRLLRRHNVSEVTIATGFLSKEIKNHFEHISLEGIRISFEEKFLPEKFFSDDTLLINDSVLTDIDVSELIEKLDNSPLLVTKSPESEFEFGCVVTDNSLHVTSYQRCPDFTHPYGSSFMGIMLIPKGWSSFGCSDLQSLAEKLCENGSVQTYSPSCYIKNISDFSSYHKCCRDFMEKKLSLPFPCEEKAPSVWIEESATVMQGSVIVPPVYIGKNSFVSKGARIEAYTQIGEDVSVDCFAGIKRSIIMDNSVIGEGSSLRGAIIGKGVHIGFESAVYEGSVIGFGTKIGRHCTVKNGVHIWPEKHIEDEGVLYENVIWGKRRAPSLFEDGSVEGITNYEITPEFAVTLGRSAVCTLGKRIAVSDDGFSGSAMLKGALIAGIMSGGGTAYDLGEQPLPITRSAVRFYSLDGGIAISGRQSEGSLRTSLDIINSMGADEESEKLRRLATLTESGEARRESAQNILEPEYLFEYKLYYLKQLINSTSQKALGAKLLINCPSVWGQELLKSAANDISCKFTFTDKDGDSFSQLLKSGEYDFGVICDYKCERLSIVKSSGKVLSPFDYCAMASLIIMKSFPETKIFVPSSAPDSIELLAEKYNSEILRTKISPPYLMNELSKSTHKSHLHQFIYHFDAVGAIILLLDFLHTEETTIDALLREIPETHTVSMDVGCAVSNQEKVIRELCKKHNVKGEETTDSIKVTFDNGWAIVVPRRSQSSISVIGHSFSQECAREIADIFIDEISEI